MVVKTGLLALPHAWAVSSSGVLIVMATERVADGLLSNEALMPYVAMAESIASKDLALGLSPHNLYSVGLCISVHSAVIKRRGRRGPQSNYAKTHLPGRLCLLMAACAKNPAENAQSNANAAANCFDGCGGGDTVGDDAHGGQSAEVLVPIKIANGYHINANPPSFPYLKATELEVPTAHGRHHVKRRPPSRWPPVSVY